MISSPTTYEQTAHTPVYFSTRRCIPEQEKVAYTTCLPCSGFSRDLSASCPQHRVADAALSTWGSWDAFQRCKRLSASFIVLGDMLTRFESFLVPQNHPVFRGPVHKNASPVGESVYLVIVCSRNPHCIYPPFQEILYYWTILRCSPPLPRGVYTYSASCRIVVLRKGWGSASDNRNIYVIRRAEPMHNASGVSRNTSL